MTLLFTSGKSIKDKVILTLGTFWPLKTKEILSYIKNNLNANVTYQAVYKSINELIEEGVILKTENGLMLDKKWVDSLRDYTNYVEQSFNFGASKKDILSSEQITVNCIWDWYYHVLTLMEKLAKDGYSTTKPMIVRATHEWNAWLFGKEEFIRAALVLKRYDIYSVAFVENPFAESLTRYWEKLGVHIARANKETFSEMSNDLVVIGDYVIQAMYPETLIKDLGKCYDEPKQVEDVDIEKLQREIFYRKEDIHIITVKNKILADNLRKETFKFFKEPNNEKIQLNS